MVRRTLAVTYRTARKIVIALLGGSVLALGVAMLVLPGPGVLVIPAGLAILGLEFAWARHWLRVVRQRGGQAAGAIWNARGRTGAKAPDRTRSHLAAGPSGSQ
jgi:tellurite resistance protein TerC